MCAPATRGSSARAADSEDAEFHERVRKAYLEIAKEAPERFRIIDARGAVDETQKAVMNTVMPFLIERGLMEKAGH